MMAINICLVKNDLRTFIDCVGNIEDNPEFGNLKKIALTMNLTIVAGIGRWCDTVINKPQIKILGQELEKLKNCPDVEQSIVIEIQNAVDAVKDEFFYLRIIGE